ncbi:folate-binding protein YgfZ [Fluoribacter dumoffii]|uniref:CAF17-like 4Fe-4S cluster assembly/insertion protein YgfZ n=1 Tax=Fluoribacter dumoffii TaxID=463 RepID=UPI00026C7614|nr:glycine cleavage system protein T [Fluoribacter dumoffii]MCW8385530.1 folate-binding protein YgfZ [Fluoribacter dumoffii]MCW8418558.1 folate-binding protein YgfZ [Fluoribacter dumoffii]MCW8453600.1 folate-binding protein YgfZ [Fluoribacter dumoffii]MCW8459182.1 folate-binding protein YgfZ [Fluoribacter dumoffii]MCW8482541.1 folate-binding protein YgfZ [Fluoribacter dumoffii]
MSNLFEHLINNRALTTLKAPEEELLLLPEKNYLFDLSYLSVIDVEGDKAIDFLQGQLTCDLNTVSDIQIIQGAQCNLKGRILVLTDIINWKGVKLVLPQDLQEATINSLNKYAQLSRVALKRNTRFSIFGFYLQNQKDIIPDTEFFPTTVYSQTYNAHSCLYYLGAGFYIFLTLADEGEMMRHRFMDKGQFLGSLTWHTLRLCQRQIEIYPESRGLFLPHRVDLQKTSYLSFNKGCYKGQEIIARMHYKATIKHELKIYQLKTEEKIYSGQKLLNKPEGAELGELIDFSILASGHYLIAVSILKEATESTLFFEGHLQSVELIDIKSFSPLKNLCEQASSV